ncbi:hypothetical protein Sste5346_009154 [Sporothrix stenoceras]|uniref:Uncharacterized protein n=1 Tax=Sporothrix stenoceras TaxID=5173 RepID=A0ABR3YL79_9PEZI
MFQDFHYRHIPALFTAGAQCWGTVYPLMVGTGGTRAVMLQYGLPENIADVPEAWPAWNAGTARTCCLGLLMFWFYARRQYAVLDTFLVAIGGYLGLADCVLLWRQRPKMAVFRLVASLAFAGTGLAGVTQGRAS